MGPEAARALMVVVLKAVNRRLIRETLTEAGFDVVTVQDPGELPDHLDPDDPPALGLVDVDGYGDDVWDACSTMAEADVPVVVLTGQRTEAIEQRTLQVGVRNVLEKPVRKANLVAIARTIHGEGAGSEG